jgi:hypothetical protein
LNKVLQQIFISSFFSSFVSVMAAVAGIVVLVPVPVLALRLSNFAPAKALPKRSNQIPVECFVFCMAQVDTNLPVPVDL